MSRVLGAVAVFIALAPLAAMLAVILYLPVWAGLGRVAAGFASWEAVRVVVLTVSVALAAAGLAVAAAVPTAYVLSRSIVRLPRIVESILLLPFGLPPVAVGALLLAFLAGPAGWLERLLSILGTWRGLLVAQFAVVYPIAVRVLRSGFDAIDPWYEAVARSLGHGGLSVFFHVVLPLARRSVATAFILSFTRAMGEFGASVMLVGLSRRAMTLPIAIYKYMSGGDIAAAVAMILVSAAAAVASITALAVVGERGVRVF